MENKCSAPTKEYLKKQSAVVQNIRISLVIIIGNIAAIMKGRILKGC